MNHCLESALPALLLFSTAVLMGCASNPETDPDASADAQTDTQATVQPHVTAATPVEAGRYLATVAGCNDCHTAGYAEAGSRIPEEDRLAGSPVGWRGPWGMTYPSNLRLTVQSMPEDAWVKILHGRTASPPMPWMNVNKLSEQDARALYQYIKSLGPKGERMPTAEGPDREPHTPYIPLEPQHLDGFREGRLRHRLRSSRTVVLLSVRGGPAVADRTADNSAYGDQ